MNNNFDALGYYKILNVNPNSAFEEIKKQYYLQAKFWHPDHNESPNALENFQKVSVAYDVLKDKKSRVQYDILSLVYKQTDFPQLGSLKIYKNQHNQDDVALRVLLQRKTYPNMQKTEVKESKDICNFKEAAEMVLSTSIHNWLRGWWGKDAWRKNIAAIKFNYNSVDKASADNLKLLIHNMLAYAQENNPQAAYIYAKQALRETAQDSRASQLIEEFIKDIDVSKIGKINIPFWSAKELKHRQLLMPLIYLIGAAIALVAAATTYGWGGFISRHAESYFEQREFSGGVLMPYDMIDAHIIKVDSSIDSLDFIYHFKKSGTVYYGPDMRYDVMRTAQKGQTVRVIGYTGNQKWLKIMFDDGDSGYIPRKYLDSGMGNPVPQNSKVYKK